MKKILKVTKIMKRASIRFTKPLRKDYFKDLYSDYSVCFYKHGYFHRDGDLPARITGDYKEYWINGKRVE